MSQFYMGVSFSLCSLIFICVTLYLFLRRKRELELENRVFHTLIIYTIILVVLEFVRTIAMSIIQTDSLLCVIIAKTTVFLTAIWEYIFVMYLALLSNSVKYKNNKNFLKNKLLPLFIGATVISFIVTIFVKLEFIGFDNDDIAYSIGGPLVYILYLITVGIFIFATIILTKNKNNIRNIFITPLYLDFESLIIILLFKILYPEVAINILVPFFVITIVICYLTIESQDNKLLFDYRIAKEKADKALKAQNEFLVNISHEIRTPMSTIIGFGESLINEKLLTDETIKENIDCIDEANEELNDLISNLLDISKIENNTEKISVEPYGLDDLLIDINKYVNEKIAGKKLKYIYNVNSNIPLFYLGERKKIFKIIAYTLENAIEYTDYGSVELNIDGKIINNNVFEFDILVHNSGHAMTNEGFKMDFEDYANMNNVLVNNRGIKLGLIIAKRLTKLLGGKIDFVNEKDHGTRYFIRVRQYANGSTIVGDINNRISQKTSVKRAYNDYSNKTILVIETEPVNIRLIANHLVPYKTKVCSSNTIHQGLEALKNNNVDAIFLDKFILDQMEENVFDVLNSVGKAIPPIVLLVSNDNELESVDYQKEGFADILQKNIDEERLGNVLSDVFINLQGVNRQ